MQVQSSSIVEIIAVDHDQVTFAVETFVFVTPTLEMGIATTYGIVIG